MAEVTPAAGPTRTASRTPCKFHLQGYCWRGSDCWFYHAPHVPQTTAPPASSSRIGTGKGARGGTAAAAAVEDDDMECLVCYEQPTEFGLLESCNHVFCLACIRSWRSSKSKESTEEVRAGYACPACRIQSNTVTPSSTFVAAGEEKDKIIQGYKDRLRAIPCKHFLASPASKRWCPFGKDCLFRHATTPTGEIQVMEHTHLDTIRRRGPPGSRRRAPTALMNDSIAILSAIESLGNAPYGPGQRERIAASLANGDLEGTLEEVLLLLQTQGVLTVGSDGDWGNAFEDRMWAAGGFGYSSDEDEDDEDEDDDEDSETDGEMPPLEVLDAADDIPMPALELVDQDSDEESEEDESDMSSEPVSDWEDDWDSDLD